MKNQILSGVIHVRDMGAMPPILRLLEREVEKGEIPGPIVIKANAIFNVDGGHPDVSPADISWAAAMGTLFTGAPSVNFKNAELQKAFEANCRSADFVKLTMDDTSLVAGKPDINRYSDDQLKTIFDLANTHNMPVAAHAMRRFGVRRVLDYPVHSLEHTVCDGPFSKKDIAQMVKRRVKVIPTTILGNLYTFTNLAEPTPNGLVSERALAEASLRQAHFDGLSFDTVEPAIHQNNLMMLEKLKTLSFKDLYKKGYYTINPHQYLPIFTHGKKNLMRMRDAGIPIGCGTDAGVPFNYHGHIAREMQCMHRLGFTNTEILIAATKTNAEILGIEKHAGTIQKGKEAHFIAMKENPLNDLSALTSLSLVVKQGHIQNA